MNKFLFSFFIMCISHFAGAQHPPAIEWQRSFGGSSSEYGQQVIQTNDGGYLIAAQIKSVDGNISGNHSGYIDCFLVKLNKWGFVQWKKCLGGTFDDIPAGICQATDGGYIMVGSSLSSDGDVPFNKGQEDYWIVKLTSEGNISWSKTYGGSNIDRPTSVIQTSDKGYIVSGTTKSFNGDVASNHNSVTYDTWLLKLDSTGIIQWQKSLGGTQDDISRSVIETANGNYAVAIGTYSNNGDVSLNYGSSDFWFVLLNRSGNIVTQKTYGGSGYDSPNRLISTRDNGFVLAGNSLSGDGNINFNHGGIDYWLIKLDSTGELQWQKTFGGSDFDAALSVIQNKQDKYVVAGYTQSVDGDVRTNDGGQDAWIILLTETGTLEWETTLGGTSIDDFYSIIQDADDDYLLCGSSSSTNGDVTANNGWSDCWIVKISNNRITCPGSNSTSFIAGPYNSLNTYQWQIDTGSGYADITDGIYYSGTVQDTLTLLNPPTNWHRYRYRCLVTTPANTIISDPYILKFQTTWTGSVSSNWLTPANWSCNTVPDRYTEVIVPDGLTNYPQVSANASVYSIMVAPDATFTVDPAVIFTVTGQ